MGGQRQSQSKDLQVEESLGAGPQGRLVHREPFRELDFVLSVKGNMVGDKD